MEVNQSNIANYLNVIEYLPSVSNLSKLDKQIFAVNVEKSKMLDYLAVNYQMSDNY